MMEILSAALDLNSKDETRSWFNQLRQLVLDFNGAEWQGEGFKKLEQEIREFISDKKNRVNENAAALLAGN